MSNILVVDDESVISETINTYLSHLGHKVSTVSSANEALLFLQKPDKVDLILSDIKMPQMNGIDFFQKYTNGNKNPARFVLMTGHGDLMNVQQAYSLGVDELLAKPFDFDILKLVIDHLLENPDSLGHEHDEYFSVPIEELMLASRSQYNLFLHVKDKYVCVTKMGQEFTPERLRNFLSKGVRDIYLNANDYAKHVDLQFALIGNTKVSPIYNAKKTKALNYLVSSATKHFLVNKINKENLFRSLHSFENYTQIAFNNSKMADLLIKYVNTSPNLIEKALLVSVISSSIADLWKWSSPKIQSRIVLGALLCDVGLMDTPHLQDKKVTEFSKVDLIDYEKHPLLSYKMLLAIEGLPKEIIQVALQHHENSIGSGFPQRQMRNDIHSFSKIVHTVSEFLEVLFDQSDLTDTKLAIDKTFKLQRKMISEQVIKSLYIIFNHTIPKELESLLLPDKIGRLI